jgi:hypothetical protein
VDQLVDQAEPIPEVVAEVVPVVLLELAVAVAQALLLSVTLVYSVAQAEQ